MHDTLINQLVCASPRIFNSRFLRNLSMNYKPIDQNWRCWKRLKLSTSEDGPLPISEIDVEMKVAIAELGAFYEAARTTWGEDRTATLELLLGGH